MSGRKLELKEISRDFEVPFIARLMRKRLLLFSVVIIFQISVMFGILFLLWHCRIKSEFSGKLLAVHPSENLIELRITGTEIEYLYPGASVTLEDLLPDSDTGARSARIKYIRNTPSGEEAFLGLSFDNLSAFIWKNLHSESLSQKGAAGEITIHARTAKLLDVLFSGKELKKLPASLS